jgi:hypothetical protein
MTRSAAWLATGGRRCHLAGLHRCRVGSDQADTRLRSCRVLRRWPRRVGAGICGLVIEALSRAAPGEKRDWTRRVLRSAVGGHDPHRFSIRVNPRRSVAAGVHGCELAWVLEDANVAIFPGTMTHPRMSGGGSHNERAMSTLAPQRRQGDLARLPSASRAVCRRYESCPSRSCVGDVLHDEPGAIRLAGPHHDVVTAGALSVGSASMQLHLRVPTLTPFLTHAGSADAPS